MSYGICIPVNNEQDNVEMDCSTRQSSDETGSTSSPAEDKISSKNNDKENQNGCKKKIGSNDCDRKMKNRKERKRLVNATIPCRFYHSKRGCWRGDKCMFLHSNNMHREDMATDHINNSKKGNGINMDIDIIDDLSNQIRTKARVSVPDKISFGRRRR